LFSINETPLPLTVFAIIAVGLPLNSFAAVKAESKARFEEAKKKGRPETRKAAMQAERDDFVSGCASHGIGR
jgi:hypothetical protein